jgi:hypothetical protein
MSGSATGCGARKEAFTFIDEDGKTDVVSLGSQGPLVQVKSKPTKTYVAGRNRENFLSSP